VIFGGVNSFEIALVEVCLFLIKIVIIILVLSLVVMNSCYFTLTVRFSIIFVVGCFCLLVFMSSQTRLSLLCYLVYVRGLIVVVLYMSVVSSRFVVSFWSWKKLLLIGVFFYISFEENWFFVPAHTLLEPLVFSSVSKNDYVCSLFIIFFVQVFIYFMILDVKSLRWF